MRVLGVHCSATHAFLAVADGGVAVAAPPYRLEPAVSTDEEHALWETLDTFAQAIDEVAPDRIHLLLPESGENTKQTHSRWRSRIEMETLLRLAAARRDLPLDRLARATVRSRLGLPARGQFDVVVRAAIQEVGPYWAAGRANAAAAALASAEEAS